MSRESDLARYQAQLDRCCRKIIPYHSGTPPQPTGIEKEMRERSEAETMWNELERKDAK